jgi:ABC-type cobalamin/Fe3+-siderophores transport system ATPase subunit
VNEGESVSIIGPNGSGKPTALKTMSRLMPIQEGQVSGWERSAIVKNVNNLSNDECTVSIKRTTIGYGGAGEKRTFPS